MKTLQRRRLFPALVIAAASCCAPPVRASDPFVTLSATDVRFGNQAQNTSSTPQTLILSNTGQADLTISSISLSGQNSADFQQTTDCPTSPAVLAAGRSCEIHLIFHPHSSTTDLIATLTISDNASGSPRSVSLHGMPTAAVPGITLAPVSLSFDSQPVNSTSAAHPIMLTNSGSATLNLNSAITISGADANEFRLAKSANACPEDSGQLPPRASCQISVVFAPVTPGGKSAQIEITDDAAGSPHVVSLSATAVPPR
jgi:hypothetical protein